jgi:uncharacterized protein
MLHSGEARRLDLGVPIDPLEYGGERYAPREPTLPAILDVSRTTGGYALRLRFAARLEGPCVRCLDDATAEVEVDAREIEQPGGGEEMDSPYVEGDHLDLRAWARDALALELPARIVCRDECRGLCAECGADLNAEPDHRHDDRGDPRWATLDELRARLSG